MLDFDFDDHRPSTPSTVDAHPVMFAAVVVAVVMLFAAPAFTGKDRPLVNIAPPSADQAILADGP